MNKDTIYIDVEDDITAIIGKVKGAKNKIIALVPPKRVGVLQSAVNMRLLARAAEQSGKRLVLISGNQALTALAASAGIPSARTLQSKPELAPIPDKGEDTDEDVIDGAKLPIGDLARTSGDAPADSPALAAAPAVDAAIRANAAEETAPARSYPRPTTAKRSGIKVPNFDTFRKKMALIVVGVLLLGGFLVWAIWFAPSAKIIVTARTIESSANPKVTISTTASTDAEAGTLKAVQQQIKKEASVTFRPTGSKEVGEKAEGQVVFHNCSSENPITIESGTGISAGGKTYITQSAATVPGAQGFATCTNAGKSSPVTVIAQDIGGDYNTDEGTRFSVAGHSNSSQVFYFRAVASTDITGGSKREVTVVTQDDVNKAIEQMKGENTEGMREELEAQFGEQDIILDNSFKVGEEGISSSPAVDAEVKDDGEARLAGTLVFTMLGVEISEAERFLDALFASELEDEENQRVYDSGAEKANFIDVRAGEGDAYSATMTATAKFGPKIDDASVKSQARGKKYGEVQSAMEQISGVQDVDVKFSPFWVRTVPDDENRISIEFNLDEPESE